jgi:2-hydroxycyclohexanecarboxyl-CoA dehydrogenase
LKAGVSAFTKSLAIEVGRHGVRVSAIAPDLMDTSQTPAEAHTSGLAHSTAAEWW